ncbi:MAG: hypothetical protein JHC26_04625 [Thermofilum sp.]|nr:hypothetical protein [Thermofilum sp.]
MEWRAGWRFAKAEFKGGRVSDLLARGYVPIIWGILGSVYRYQKSRK